MTLFKIVIAFFLVFVFIITKSDANDRGETSNVDNGNSELIQIIKSKPQSSKNGNQKIKGNIINDEQKAINSHFIEKNREKLKKEESELVSNEIDVRSPEYYEYYYVDEEKEDGSKKRSRRHELPEYQYYQRLDAHSYPSYTTNNRWDFITGRYIQGCIEMIQAHQNGVSIEDYFYYLDKYTTKIQRSTTPSSAWYDYYLTNKLQEKPIFYYQMRHLKPWTDGDTPPDDKDIPKLYASDPAYMVQAIGMRERYAKTHPWWGYVRRLDPDNLLYYTVINPYKRKIIKDAYDTWPESTWPKLWKLYIKACIEEGKCIVRQKEYM